MAAVGATVTFLWSISVSEILLWSNRGLCLVPCQMAVLGAGGCVFTVWQRAKKLCFLPSAGNEERRAEEWDRTGSRLHRHRSCEGKIRDLFLPGGLVLMIHYRAVALLFQSE